MTKILIVLSSLSAGGAESMFMSIFKKINKEKLKFDFLIFSNDSNLYSDILNEYSCKVSVMPSLKKVGIFKFIKFIRKYIRENGGFNIIHSHIDYLSSLVLYAAKKEGVHVRIAHSHNTNAITHLGKLNKIQHFISKLLVNYAATDFLCCSYKAGIYMFGGKNKDKFKVINNSIDLEKFDGLLIVDRNKLLDFNSNSHLLLHIGRFVEQKNHLHLIDIFYNYLQEKNDALLLLLGDGPLKEDVMRYVKSLGISEKVIFLGIKNNVHEYLSICDCLLLPSKYEGIPVTLIEAQSMNVPCIVSSNIDHKVDCKLNLIHYVDLDDFEKWNIEINKAINSRKKQNNYQTLDLMGYNIKKNIEIIDKLYCKEG